MGLAPDMRGTVEWDTDDRPASLYTRLYVQGMRLARDKEAFEGERHTLRVARERQGRGDSSPTLLTRAALRVSRSTVADLTVWTLRPRRRRPVATVLYLHGGGYIHPLTADYWRLVRALARSPAEIVVPGYPLAPGATVDTVLPHLLALYERTAGAGPDVPVVLMGDSAGGALALEVAIALRDAGTREPAGVVALSPWLDAALEESEVQELEASDPMLAESGLRAAGRWWAGSRDPSDPAISPVHATMRDLPPVDVYIGDRDILRPAVDALAERARRDGARLHVHEVTAMFHVWMTRALPEARRTRRALARLVARRAASA